MILICLKINRIVISVELSECSRSPPICNPEDIIISVHRNINICGAISVCKVESFNCQAICV